MKGKNRRSRVEFPALIRKYNLRIRQESIDFDYLEKLSKEDLDWLNRFMEEYNNASFKHDTIDGAVETRRKSYRTNNYRNRDIFSRAKAQGIVDSLSEIEFEELVEKNQRSDLSEEDIWIKKIDSHNKGIIEEN